MKGKYLNLRSEIIRAGFTCYNVAEAIGISPQALSQKMNGSKESACIPHKVK